MKKASTADKKLKALRKEIDSVDRLILSALSKRMKIVKKIGHVKRKFQIPVIQKKRWKDIIASRVKAAQKAGLDKKFVSRFLKTIHDEAIKIQMTIVKKGSRT